ncbi:VgrG-related protein [Kitasatospora sp. NPDC101176]|uniref:VgrG-related protein n=1 Tax=Kitasatospora sp. NPDC101176 TaxID=3364099 RepID=UPI0038253839
MSDDVATPVSVDPQVRAGGTTPTDLSQALSERIVRVVVDSHLHLPDMFEITFYENDLEAGTAADEPSLQLGCHVEVLAASGDHPTGTRLILGEITAVEAVCENMTVYTVVRGYDASHRLQRARRSHVYLNQSDGEIARQLAKASGLTVGEIANGPSSPYVAQTAESDWDFLRRRATAGGFEVGVRDGKFFFRRTVASSGGGPRARLPELVFGDNLLSFRPQVSSDTLAPQVEVRSWHAETSKVVVGRAPVRSPDAVLESGTTAQKAAQMFAPAALPGAKVGDAPAPAPDAFVVPDCSAGPGAGAAAGAEAAARAVAERLARSHCEATGCVVGEPGVVAGAVVEVCGVPRQFAGRWRITRARHVFDENEGGYRTRFEIGGPDAAAGAVADTRPSPSGGLVCGLVSDINDPAGAGRVRVRLPWLAPDFQTDWARVVHGGAGRRGGALLLPEVGDEVLVGYELGDSRRPFVLGGLLNTKAAYHKDGLGGPMVEVKGKTARLARQGLVSPSGNRLVFIDNVPEAGGKPTQSTVVLGTGRDELALTIDRTAKAVTLACRPEPGGPSGLIRIECAKNGTVTIEAAKGGTVNVRSGSDGTVNIEGGRAVNVKGGSGSVSLEGGDVQVTASRRLALKSSGAVTISGTAVNISGTPIKLN